MRASKAGKCSNTDGVFRKRAAVCHNSRIRSIHDERLEQWHTLAHPLLSEIKKSGCSQLKLAVPEHFFPMGSQRRSCEWPEPCLSLNCLTRNPRRLETQRFFTFGEGEVAALCVVHVSCYLRIIIDCKLRTTFAIAMLPPWQICCGESGCARPRRRASPAKIPAIRRRLHPPWPPCNGSSRPVAAHHDRAAKT